MALRHPQTNSFIFDIEEAIFAQVETELGQGSATYPSPAWLQVVSTKRGGGRPLPTVAEKDKPCFVMEYIGGTETDTLIAGRRRSGGATELWNVYVFFNLTPELMGCARQQDEFAGYAVAAADTLMRRVVYMLDELTINVTDSILGYMWNGQRPTAWALVGMAKGDFNVDYTITLRLEVQAEI